MSSMPPSVKAEPSPRWVVFGASGFVGSAIVRELERRGSQVRSIQAPRLEAKVGLSSAELISSLPALSHEVDNLVNQLSPGDTVINAAGLAEPDSPGTPRLIGANALLPRVIAEAAARASAKHFLHLSSAAVQGNVRVLDSSPKTGSFSPYSKSKALGEAVVLDMQQSGSHLAISIVRATSVQGPGRRTTQRLQKLASSPMASAAKPGTQQTSVSSIYGLVDFVLATAASPKQSPQIVLQPWEGGTVESVLELASGGKKPLLLPAPLCRTAIAAGGFLSSILGGRVSGHVRRLELMWFGQSQEVSELDARLGSGPTKNLVRALTPPLNSVEEGNHESRNA